ncbi:MAG: aldose 1-epimerase [Candidatus Bathyarchaeota archaeon]
MAACKPHMFKIEPKPFGFFTKINLVNPQTKEYVSIIPEFGANVNEMVLNKNGINHSILDGSKSYSELIKNEWFKGAKLIPFPNRINNGQYSFDEKKYQLPINFPLQNHAIHGLLYDKKFRVKERIVTEKQASVTLEHFYKGKIQGYPFRFNTSIKYSLTENKGFKCVTLIKNLDTTRIPIGDGWHPYFKTRGKVNNLSIRVPSTQKIEVNKRTIPTGNIISFKNYSSLSKIGKEELDTGFLLKKKGGIASTEVYDPKQDLKILLWQETGKMKYNYLQVFIPPSRKSIAIEPMTCNIDVFNNEKGLIVLAPKQSFKASYGVSLT